MATSGPAAGKLVHVDPQLRLKGDTVTFADVEAGFAYAVEDSLMAVGDALVHRSTGWPMGGSHSEPAALVDSG
eukprot:6304354-Alexandrium_andersonii.AAC.1